MTQDEFLRLWREQRPAYEAWGKFVREQVEAGIIGVDPELDTGSFLKMKPEPRVKQEDSLLEKAFLRGKGYQDPFNQIEDKVGVRFVVLLTRDIEIIQSAIECNKYWSFSLDRDFEAEKDLKPAEFGYQSKHYVVRALEAVKFGGIVIPAGTPCEIQIRTLLQHAHSELTHDKIYKREGGSEIGKKVYRAVAKSMALIEAVDDYFLVAIDALEDASEVERSATKILRNVYKKHLAIEPADNKSLQIILAAYRDDLVNLEARIESMLAARPYILTLISQRAGTKVMYRQSWVLLIYLLVHSAHRLAADRWPFPIEEIRPIFVDLGKTPPD